MNSTLAMIIRVRLDFKVVSQFLRLDLMYSKSVDAVLAAVVHELLGNGGQRADDNNR